VLAADRGTVLARLQSGIVVTWRRAATQRGREHTGRFNGTVSTTVA
jgi:hypothetical protein